MMGRIMPATLLEISRTEHLSWAELDEEEDQREGLVPGHHTLSAPTIETWASAS